LHIFTYIDLHELGLYFVPSLTVSVKGRVEMGKEEMVSW